MPKLVALDSIQFGFISYPYISETWLQWLGFQALLFFETLKSNFKKVKPRKSKDRTLPKKVVENPLLIWIILKTILCLVLDIQGKYIQTYLQLCSWWPWQCEGRTSDCLCNKTSEWGQVSHEQQWTLHAILLVGSGWKIEILRMPYYIYTILNWVAMFPFTN